MIAAAALVCTVLALVSAGAVLARTRSLAQALPVLLELLLAAGLLRLAHDATWRTIATAAVVVALRRLVATYGLRPAAAHGASAGQGSRRDPGPGSVGATGGSSSS